MKTYKSQQVWISDYLKSGLVVLVILGAMIYCDTDEFTHRCLAGEKEFCVGVGNGRSN